MQRGRESWVRVSCDRAIQRVAVNHEGLAPALCRMECSVAGGWGITIRQEDGRG